MVREQKSRLPSLSGSHEHLPSSSVNSALSILAVALLVLKERIRALGQEVLISVSKNELQVRVSYNLVVRNLLLNAPSTCMWAERQVVRAGAEETGNVS